MYRKLFIIPVFIFSALCNAINFEPTFEKIDNYEDSLKDIDRVVNEALQQFPTPGVAVGVIADDKVRFARGYGMRNVQKRLPVTENTLFPIASCSKAFTALILAQLVDEKLISWDDPVIKYIPEFRLLNEQVASEITIRDLMAHRTGVPRHDAIWFCNRLSRSDVLPLLQYLEPICELRTNWYYNNFMYSVGGILIERLTGQSWEEAVNSRILSPLKMIRSNVGTEQLYKKQDFSLPYTEINGLIQTLPFHHFNGVEPAAAIHSSVIDMLKWVEVQLGNENTINKAFITLDGLEEMHSLHIPFSANEREVLGISQLGYGLGWFVGDYRGYRVINHQGSNDGFQSEVLLLPQKNIGIVILCNSSSNGFYTITSIRNTILDRLLGTCDTNWIEFVKTKKEQARLSSIAEENKEVRNAPRRLQDYVGKYVHPAYGDVQVYMVQNQLRAFYGDIVMDLNCTQGNAFKGKQSQSIMLDSKGRIFDFEFYEDHNSRHVNEVRIAFDSVAKPIIFKRK